MTDAARLPVEIEAERRIAGISRNVFLLGLASFLGDISSEMTLTILPLFLTNVLGIKIGIVGLIEGIADSTALLLRIGSGWFSDRVGARKPPIVWGSVASMAAKLCLLIASSWWLVLGARIADRVGKGIRAAPHDALLADSATQAEMGKNFGFFRAMSAAGGVVGLGLAALIVYLMDRGSLLLEPGTFQVLVGIGVLPTVPAVLIILFLVTEVKRRTVLPDPASPQARTVSLASVWRALSLREFDRRFRLFIVIVVAFTLGSSSDAFLILRAQNLGLPVAQILIMLAMFNVVYAGMSVPAGVLSDRLGRRRVVTLGWLVYAFVYLGFALASELWQIWGLFVLYGSYYAAVINAAKALVADLVPSHQRGTAYGLYSAATGIATLPASVIAGFLWQVSSPAAPFYFGAVMAGIAAALLFIFLRKQ